MMILFVQQIAGKDDLSRKKQIVIWTIIIVFLTGCVVANRYILQKRVKKLFIFLRELIRYFTLVQACKFPKRNSLRFAPYNFR
jgi:hypothetical protein